MEISVSVERLRPALQTYGSKVREFTPVPLSRNREVALAVLRELGDAAQLSDGSYRLQLSEDVVARAILIVEAIQDQTDRRVVEASLPTRPEFFNKTVIQRKAMLEKEGISADVFRTRRSRVLPDVAVALAREFRGRSSSVPLLGIAGDYDNPELDAAADAFGMGLAELRIGLVSGYAAAGQRISRAMADALSDKGVVDSDRITQYARIVKGRSQPSGPGQLIMYGKTQEEKRHRMLRDCKVVVLFGGGAGTTDEARIAERYRIPVIPMGFSGGAALRYWQDTRSAAESVILGGHPVDPVLYEQLGHVHHHAAVRAALALVRQAITAQPVDSCGISQL